MHVSISLEDNIHGYEQPESYEQKNTEKALDGLISTGLYGVKQQKYNH